MDPEITTLFQEYLKLTKGNKAAAASLVVAHFLAASRNLPVVDRPEGSNVAEKEKGSSIQIGSDDQFAELAKASNCLQRLQLCTKGKAVNRKMVKAGNYGITVSGEEVNDLGNQIDIIPLARRPQAIDMTDDEAIIVCYDPDSEAFKRIAAKSLEKGLFRDLGGARAQVEVAAMEVNGSLEVVEVAEAASRVLHPLDLRVDAFAGGIGDSVLQVGEDVR